MTAHSLRHFLMAEDVRRGAAETASPDAQLAILTYGSVIAKLEPPVGTPVYGLDRTHLWHHVPLASWIGSYDVN